MCNVGPYFPEQISNMCSLYWKHGVLTTGLPAKFPLHMTDGSLNWRTFIYDTFNNSIVGHKLMKKRICVIVGIYKNTQFSSIQSLSRVLLFATP